MWIILDTILQLNNKIRLHHIYFIWSIVDPQIVRHKGIMFRTVGRWYPVSRIMLLGYLKILLEYIYYWIEFDGVHYFDDEQLRTCWEDQFLKNDDSQFSLNDRFRRCILHHMRKNLINTPWWYFVQRIEDSSGNNCLLRYFTLKICFTFCLYLAFCKNLNICG